jgi:hypothetical protein
MARRLHSIGATACDFALKDGGKLPQLRAAHWHEAGKNIHMNSMVV